MRSVSLLFLAIGIVACGGNNNQTVTINLDPVDATGATDINVANDTGDIVVQGEAGRTTVDVEVTFTGGVQEEFDQVTATSALSATAVNVDIDVPSNLPNVVASVKVLVPEGLVLDVQGSVGNVEASGLTGGATILTDSGDITCKDIVGGIKLTTNAGEVAINTGLNQGDRIEVDTEFIGDIDLTLPGAVVADVNAVTGGGAVAIGAAFNFVGTNTDGVAQGTLNGGDAQTVIDLFTQSGNISLLAQ